MKIHEKKSLEKSLHYLLSLGYSKSPKNMKEGEWEGRRGGKKKVEPVRFKATTTVIKKHGSRRVKNKKTHSK
jgi:hypothetical protein